MDADGGIWAATLVALVIVSSLSLLGSLTLLVQAERVRGGLVILVPFAAGALLGDAWLHIVPEIAESEAGFNFAASVSVVAGIVVFFVLEKVLHWHHSHFPHEEMLHPVAVSNLVGDGLHNFIDGAIVAGSFVVSPSLGIATTAAVALHEIPQELGDFGILLHAGLSPRRALTMNFLSGLAAVVGGALTLLWIDASVVERVLLPISAGAFIYIASTDLIPELHKEPEPLKSLIQVIALVLGLLIMAALLLLE
jgi:zinc and cadmium transporter